MDKETPTIRMFKEDFDALLEYSCSLPTGTEIGKRWKRDQNAYLPLRKLFFGWYKPKYRANWFVGEYAESKQEGKVDIIWRKPIIYVKRDREQTTHPRRK